MRNSLSLVLVLVLTVCTFATEELLSDQKSEEMQKQVDREFAPPILRSDPGPAALFNEGSELIREDESLYKATITDQIEQLKNRGLPVPQELIEAVGQFTRSDILPDRDRDRQGGDTIEEAEPVSLGTTVTGTTVGYNDDYDEVCPYTGSTSPDVVYILTLAEETPAILDLCDADYDSKLYVYDEDMNLLGCSDDDCSLQSILTLTIPAGDAYIVVDGYGGQDGTYSLTLTEFIPSGGDFCDDPILIDELPYSTTGTTVDNSNSYGNPSPDEWYALEILESGNTLITMCANTGYDSYLRLLSSDCATEIAYNDDSCGLVSEMINFLTPGDYVICVEGYSSNSGSFTLDVTHSPFEPGQGDYCDDPWIVDEFPFTVSETTTDNIDVFGNSSPDEWYSIDVLEEGLLTISLCEGTTFNSYIHLLEDDCVTVIATDDYGCGDWEIPLSWLSICNLLHISSALREAQMPLETTLWRLISSPSAPEQEISATTRIW